MAKSYEFRLTCSAKRRPTESAKHMIPRNLKMSKCGQLRKGIKFSFNWLIWDIELILNFNRKTIKAEKLNDFLKSQESISMGSGY